MKGLLPVAVYLFSVLPAYSQSSISCEDRWNRIISYYERDHNELFSEAESAWNNANFYKNQRGDKLPGQEGAMSLEEWKEYVRNQKSSINRAARKLEEARRIYNYYERPQPTSGWQSYFKWSNPRRTHYAIDIEELIRDRSCRTVQITYKNKLYGISRAAEVFDNEVRRKTSRQIERVKELRKMADWLEESEIKRLDPDRHAHCLYAGRRHAHPTLIREFCGEIDSVGYQKLMPFLGCVSNLDYWGYTNHETTRYSYNAPSGRRDLRSTSFFDTCKQMDNIQAMISGDHWRRCMRRVAPQYSFAGDAARNCLAENPALSGSNRGTGSSATNNSIDPQGPGNPQ